MKEALLLVFANKQDIQGGEGLPFSTFIPFHPAVFRLKKKIGGTVADSLCIEQQ